MVIVVNAVDFVVLLVFSFCCSFAPLVLVVLVVVLVLVLIFVLVVVDVILSILSIVSVVFPLVLPAHPVPPLFLLRFYSFGKNVLLLFLCVLLSLFRFCKVAMVDYRTRLYH